MATIDYKERYENLVEAVKKLQEANQSNEGIQNWVSDNVPELAESNDERIRKNIIHYIKFEYDNNIIPHQRAELWIAWLEKQGEQKLAEWSEEDENLFNRCVINIQMVDSDDTLKIWLKSLKDRVQSQSQWKPSDKQMNTLEYYMHTLVCNEHKEILFGLYADLKKLREGKL